MHKTPDRQKSGKHMATKEGSYFPLCLPRSQASESVFSTGKLESCNTVALARQPRVLLCPGVSILYENCQYELVDPYFWGSSVQLPAMLCGNGLVSFDRLQPLCKNLNRANFDGAFRG